jgi:hypothetical protein
LEVSLGASKEKKIFLNSIFFNFYGKNMLFCTFWSTETLLLKIFRRIQHAGSAIVLALKTLWSKFYRNNAQEAQLDLGLT